MSAKHYLKRKAPRLQQRWAALGQGVVEYALMLIFAGAGLVIVTGAAYTGMSNRVSDVICNVGNEGREARTCEEVAYDPPAPPETPEETPAPEDLDPETPRPPIADFQCLCDGLDCYLDGQLSYDQDEAGQSITAYNWDFGGNGSDSGATVAKTFASEGTFPVTLTVTDDEGETASDTGSCVVSLSLEPPVAEYTWNNPANTLVVNFDGGMSYDQDEAGNFITRWQWDIGNDGSFEMEGETPSYEFESGGSYPVRLVVTDDENVTAETVKTVRVGLGPEAFASGACETGLFASFDASESFDRDNQDADNNGILEWSWDFGEGVYNGSSTLVGSDAAAQAPQDVRFPRFDETFLVTLTVSDSDFNTASTELEVYCGNQPPTVEGITLYAVAGGDNVVDNSTRATDPEGDEMSATWPGMPTWFTQGASLQNDNTTLRYNFGAPIGSEGTYNGQVCVNDGHNDDVCAAVTVVVEANQVPDITVRNYELEEGSTYVDIEQFAWDNDIDDMLTISYTGMPGFVTKTDMGTQQVVDQERGTHMRHNLQYDLQPGDDTVGTYNVTACVTDGIAETCRDFQIIVNDAPLECPPFPDFDALPAGTALNNQFDGMRIYSLPNGGGNVEDFQRRHPVWTYNSEEAGGGEDPDLGTPNRAFTFTDSNGVTRHGPGDAAHGRQNDGEMRSNWAATVVDGPYVNDEPLGNLIIIQEDVNRAPDDNGGGGRIVFEFDYPALIGTIRFVDVDDGRAATVSLFDASGEPLGQGISPNDAGENTVVPLVLDQNNVSRMEVQFPGSGAIDAIFFCDQGETNTVPAPNEPPAPSEPPAPTPAPEPEMSVSISTHRIENNQAQFKYRLSNTGQVAVDNVTVRVYFNRDGDYSGEDYVLERWWDESNMATVTGPFHDRNRIYYFDIVYSGTIEPGQTYQFNTSLHLNNWNNRFNETNDHWFTTQSGGSNFVPTEYLPVYVNGELVEGIER